MKAKPPFLRLKPGFDLALGKVLLTGVGTAPSSETDMYFQYKKLSLLKEVKKYFREMTQGTLCSDMVSESLREPRKSRKDIVYTYSEPSESFLTVSIAPFVNAMMIHSYKNLPLK